MGSSLRSRVKNVSGERFKVTGIWSKDEVRAKMQAEGPVHSLNSQRSLTVSERNDCKLSYAFHFENPFDDLGRRSLSECFTLSPNRFIILALVAGQKANLLRPLLTASTGRPLSL